MISLLFGKERARRSTFRELVGVSKNIFSFLPFVLAIALVALQTDNRDVLWRQQTTIPWDKFGVVQTIQSRLPFN